MLKHLHKIVSEKCTRNILNNPTLKKKRFSMSHKTMTEILFIVTFVMTQNNECNFD